MAKSAGSVGDWMTVFSLNDISGLKRPERQICTKVASSRRMMHTLRFLEKVF